MINAVLFDMDGVLFDTEQLYFKTLSGIMLELGYEMDLPFFIGTLGIPNRQCQKMYMDIYGDDFPYESVYTRLFASTREYAAKHGTPLKSGARECMEALRARGLKMVLATSCPRFAVDEFFRTAPDMERMLSGKVCGDEVSEGKPNPEIFRKAAQLARFNPAECLGVEDSASGLRAIHAAGAYAVMIPDMLAYSPSLAPYTDAVLESISELPALIDRLNAKSSVVQ